ncbi:hypothetical protein LJC46_04170 [Desulfovibrio sp. OttesenSCG-928-G15]|nr:hypothetical protein [Desulfovibrio sp. OttesenSCG-928-G15]
MSSNKDTQAMADMLTALKSPEMRRVLFRVFVKSNIFQPSFVRGDALTSAHNEGLRAVGLWLKGEIDKADPEAFARLLTGWRENK